MGSMTGWKSSRLGCQTLAMCTAANTSEPVEDLMQGCREEAAKGKLVLGEAANQSAARSRYLVPLRGQGLYAQGLRPHIPDCSPASRHVKKPQGAGIADQGT